ncbi:MAG: ACT domain-containing protein, partial [Xanthobacteraceae bacterium]
DGNIDNIRMFARSSDFTRMLIDVEVYDLRHLNGIVSDLRARPVVSMVERVNG